MGYVRRLRYHNASPGGVQQRESRLPTAMMVPRPFVDLWKSMTKIHTSTSRASTGPNSSNSTWLISEIDMRCPVVIGGHGKCEEVFPVDADAKACETCIRKHCSKAHLGDMNRAAEGLSCLWKAILLD